MSLVGVGVPEPGRTLVMKPRSNVGGAAADRRRRLAPLPGLLPELEGKLDALAIRARVPDGSIVDLVGRLR